MSMLKHNTPEFVNHINNFLSHLGSMNGSELCGRGRNGGL
jgi:hypothetical protein